MQKDSKVKIKDDADSNFAGKKGVITSVEGEYVKVQLDDHPLIKPMFFAQHEVELRVE